jgi:hypothetical protein
MQRFDRRLFLKGSSLGVAAAGALAAVPGLPSLLGEAEADAPAVDNAASGAATDVGVGGETIVAHLRDAATGEVAIYAGERQVIVRSSELVAQLLRAAR